jgi:hypothetical protein
MVPYADCSLSDVDTITSSEEQYMTHHLNASAKYQPKSYPFPLFVVDNSDTFYEEHSEDHLEEGKEVPLIVPAGTLVIIGSTVLHRSGRNTSDHWRRAFMPQYSTSPAISLEEGKLVAYAVPLT